TFSDFGDVIQGANRLEKYPNFGKRTFFVERQGDKDVSVTNPNVNRQVGSGYKQYDFLQKFSFQASDKVKHILNLQYSNTSDVPRYDRLTEVRNNAPRFAEWYYGPEKRLMAAYQLELRGTIAYDKAFISAAYQDIEESRISRSFNNINRKSQLERVKVYSLNADFQKSVNKNTLNYGIELVSNDVNSTAVFTTITTSVERKADTRYPDGENKMNTWAAYLTDHYKFSDKLIGQIGFRYSGSSLSAEFIEKSFFPFPFNSIEQKTNALTGNVGLIFNPTEKTKLSILGSSGYRTPNIDDLAKVFDSVSGTLVVPNPDIKPEYTYNGEITVSQKIGDRVRIEGTYFYTKFQNAIVVDAFTLNGQSTVSYNGVLSKVMASQNKAKATVNGWNVNFYANLMDGLTLSSTLNSTQGIINDDKKTPLDHIPPMFGRTGLKFQRKLLQVEVFSIYNGWKKLKDYSPSGEDNLIYATADGMPSWWTLNLRTAYQVQKNIQIQLACENILDRNYRTFASGISSQGRNFVITLRGGL
nr:TonB-dependent receptor [Spirosomataceae bacterium]